MRERTARYLIALVTVAAKAAGAAAGAKTVTVLATWIHDALTR